MITDGQFITFVVGNGSAESFFEISFNFFNRLTEIDCGVIADGCVHVNDCIL